MTPDPIPAFSSIRGLLPRILPVIEDADLRDLIIRYQDGTASTMQFDGARWDKVYRATLVLLEHMVPAIENLVAKRRRADDEAQLKRSQRDRLFVAQGAASQGLQREQQSWNQRLRSQQSEILDAVNEATTEMKLDVQDDGSTGETIYQLTPADSRTLARWVLDAETAWVENNSSLVESRATEAISLALQDVKLPQPFVFERPILRTQARFTFRVPPEFRVKQVGWFDAMGRGWKAALGGMASVGSISLLLRSFGTRPLAPGPSDRTLSAGNNTPSAGALVSTSGGNSELLDLIPWLMLAALAISLVVVLATHPAELRQSRERDRVKAKTYIQQELIRQLGIYLEDVRAGILRQIQDQLSMEQARFQRLVAETLTDTPSTPSLRLPEQHEIEAMRGQWRQAIERRLDSGPTPKT